MLAPWKKKAPSTGMRPVQKEQWESYIRVTQSGTMSHRSRWNSQKEGIRVCCHGQWWFLQANNPEFGLKEEWKTKKIEFQVGRWVWAKFKQIIIQQFNELFPGLWKKPSVEQKGFYKKSKRGKTQMSSEDWPTQCLNSMHSRFHLQNPGIPQVGNGKSPELWTRKQQFFKNEILERFIWW